MQDRIRDFHRDTVEHRLADLLPVEKLAKFRA